MEILGYYSFGEDILEFICDGNKVFYNHVDNIPRCNLSYKSVSDGFVARFLMSSPPNGIILYRLKYGYVGMEYSVSFGFMLGLYGYTLNKSYLQLDWIFSSKNNSYQLMVSDRIAELIIADRSIVKLFLENTFHIHGGYCLMKEIV